MSEPCIVEELSRIAHNLWCRRMEARGWRFGPTYDQAARTHDALVAFDRLAPADRRATMQAVAMLDLGPELERAVDYDRGPEREFTLEEMRPGLRVTWALGTVFDDPARAGAGEQGVIESWEAQGGELTLLRVRWLDGTLSEHFPSEQEFRRLD